MAGLFLAYLYIQVYEMIFFCNNWYQKFWHPNDLETKAGQGKLGGVKIGSFQACGELGQVEATWSHGLPPVLKT